MKRSLITAGGGLLGILLTVMLLESGAAAIRGRQSAVTETGFTLETPDLADVPDLGSEDMASGGVTNEDTGNEAMPGNPAEIGPQDKPLRDIAPEQFALPQEVTAQPLERIEPRMPLSDPVARPEPVPLVLRHPVALSAGLIRFGDRLLQLDGLAPQNADRLCGEAERPWPCGLVARTALRNYLRARALICRVPKDGWQGTLTAACTVNKADPAVWLAENGWADASAGSPLAAKVDAARKSRLGFFGGDPRDFTATPVPLDESPVPGSTEAGTIEQGL